MKKLFAILLLIAGLVFVVSAMEEFYGYGFEESTEQEPSLLPDTLVEDTVLISDSPPLNTDKIEKIESCIHSSWEEENPVFGICTKEIAQRICDDEPINESCHNISDYQEYRCLKQVQKIIKSKDECKTTGLEINNEFLLETTEYACSAHEESSNVILVCDSKYDGNGDGICQSGESCLKYTIENDEYSVLQKNSFDNFVESDPTFFLSSPKIEVLK